MKTFISAVALVMALAATGPAFAGDVSKATTQADCEKAGGIWHADSKTCTKKSSGGY
jgi:hypothetical protein